MYATGIPQILSGAVILCNDSLCASRSHVVQTLRSLDSPSSRHVRGRRASLSQERAQPKGIMNCHMPIISISYVPCNHLHSFLIATQEDVEVLDELPCLVSRIKAFILELVSQIFDGTSRC